MKTSFFDAVVDISTNGQPLLLEQRVNFRIRKENAAGEISFYEAAKLESGERFAAVSLTAPLAVKWGYGFEILKRETETVRGTGRVLYPSGGSPTGREVKRRLALLPHLIQGKEAMILALTRDSGFSGLKEADIFDLAPLTRKTLLPLCQKLESDGKIRILSFTPLFLLSQESFEFLKEKILEALNRFHKGHPQEPGILKTDLRKKFVLPERIWSLALKHLFQKEQIKESGKRLSLFAFNPVLTPEEEGLLDRLEKMCLEGRLHSVSAEELQRHFRLSARRVQNLLSLLAERRKIVQSEDGFILHSQWLEELVEKIRSSGEKELSVGMFKEMTGLSRKYAIPLLELLDQMGVTRRRGPTREIL